MNSESMVYLFSFLFLFFLSFFFLGLMGFRLLYLHHLLFYREGGDRAFILVVAWWTCFPSCVLFSFSLEYFPP